MNVEEQSKPPFISSQRLFHLVADSSRRKECLTPTALARMRAEVQEASRSGEQRPHLRIVPRRIEFLTSPQFGRLCLTVESGIGKSTVLRQAGWLRSRANRGLPDAEHTMLRNHLVLRLDFEDLPESVESIQRVLTRVFSLKLRDHTGRPLTISDHVAWRCIEHQIFRGKLTLLIDSLDQTSGSDGDHLKAKALATFLDRYSSCTVERPNAPHSHAYIHCIVAGRPFAIDAYWRSLFADPDRPEITQWDFVLVDTFRESEVRTFLTPARFRCLRLLDATDIVNPRALTAVRKRAPAELIKLASAADIYWMTIQESIEAAMRVRPGSRLLRPGVLKLYSRLAFLAVRQQRSRLRSGELERVVEDEQATGSPLDITHVWDDLLELGRNDVFLMYAARDQSGMEYVSWQNDTLRDFFAAYWMCRYGTETEREWLRENLFVRSDQNSHRLYDFWRFLTQMPEVAWCGFEDNYALTLSVLFRPGTRVRSTEMIYRAWPTMLRLAGWLPVGRTCDDSVDSVTNELRSALAKGVEYDRIATSGPGGEDIPAHRSARGIARQSITEFLLEFSRLRTAVGDPDAKRVALQADREFRCGIPVAGTSNRMGQAIDGATDFVSGRPLRFGTVPVTNEVYSLFDAGHAARFPDYRNRSPGPRCPAILLDWYDAWCVAVWLEGMLPSLDEWNRASLASPHGADKRPWWFGDDVALLRFHAWYAQNSGADPSHCFASNVGASGHFNDYGIADMHGLVSEWTRTSVPPTDSDGMPTGRWYACGGSYMDVAVRTRCENPLEVTRQSAREFTGVRVVRIDRPTT